MNKLNLTKKFVDQNSSCYIIAEIGQAHDGSLGSAYAYIDAVADTGVNAIKFQTHIATEESTKHEKFRIKVFPQDETRYDYWKRMEFTPQQWKDLANYTRQKGLEFLSTPFSIEAVNLLEEIGVPAWKIGSGDISNYALLEAILKTRKPILLSSGMSSFQELDATIQMITQAGVDYGLFQCTTSYPCSAESIGYNVITEMKERYNCLVGLSDHSGTIFPSLAAVTLGAKLIEVHAVFSKRCFGPDTLSSLTIEELQQLVDGIKFIEKGLASPVNKNEAATSRGDTKQLFARSAFYNANFPKGTLLEKSHFSMKKPGGGLNFEQVKKLLGKTINKDRSFDDFIELGDFT
jgi:N,N'-diacetyllegionaminate synthase